MLITYKFYNTLLMESKISLKILNKMMKMIGNPLIFLNLFSLFSLLKKLYKDKMISYMMEKKSEKD
jgi:choline-glycine betaine transporter